MKTYINISYTYIHTYIYLTHTYIHTSYTYTYTHTYIHRCEGVEGQGDLVFHV